MEFIPANDSQSMILLRIIVSKFKTLASPSNVTLPLFPFLSSTRILPAELKITRCEYQNLDRIEFEGGGGEKKGRFIINALWL